MSDNLTTEQMLAALGWHTDDGHRALDAAGRVQIIHPPGGSGAYYWPPDQTPYGTFGAAVEAAYKARLPKSEPDARRELTARKLADLGWAQIGKHYFADSQGRTRILHRSKGWEVCSVDGATFVLGYTSIDAAVDAAHLARFPIPPVEYVTPDDVPGYPLLWQSPDRMSGAVCIRGTRIDVYTIAADFPQGSLAVDVAARWKVGYAAVFEAAVYVQNHPRPVAPDEDRCETSQADLQAAEIERNWSDVAWLQAELKKARDRIAKQATEAANACTKHNYERDVITEIESALGPRETWPDGCDIAGVIVWMKAEFNRLTTELAAANNRANAAEKLLGPVATYLGGHWTVQVGDLPVLVAWLEGSTSATIDGWDKEGEPTSFYGRDEADIVALVNHLLAFRGIRVQE